jgi:hypothetical protein
MCVVFVVISAISSTIVASERRNVQAVARSRNYVLEYCRINCEQNTAKPRLPYRATFEKALAGDFDALNTIFTNGTYHNDDLTWTEVPWHLLQVVGDSRFAAFVLSHPSPERKQILALVPSSSVTSAPDETSDSYFREHFPRTYALYKAAFQEEPESPSLDYSIRHLSRALAAQPRFNTVRLSRSVKTGTTLVTASRSLSKKDITDLRSLIQKHLGTKAELVFE